MRLFAVASAALLFSTVALPSTATAGPREGGVASSLASYTSGSVTRLAGPDRYATAAAISKAVFPVGVPVAYVATGATFPDALGAGPAAARQGGPLLLVSKSSIPSVTANELKRLKPGRIVIAGGSATVSTSVQSALSSLIAGGTSACPASLQALVDGAPAGATLSVGACTFREALHIRRPLTLVTVGGVIDGEGVRSGITVRASDVTLDGWTVRNTRQGHTWAGAVDVRGVSRANLRNLRISGASSMGIYLEGGGGHRIEGVQVGPVGVTGIHLQKTADTLIRDSILRDANLAGASDAMWEAGGTKIFGSTRITVERVEASGNNGPGIWFDGGSSAVVVRHNRVFGNTRAGIFFEISDGALIEHNRVWENGWSFTAWGWGAGIVVASSRNAEVRDNTVAWNADGIVVLSQNRGAWGQAVNNSVHRNVIVLAPQPSDSSDKFLLGWLQDWDGPLFRGESNNRGANNRYWHAQSEPSWARFSWSGHHSRLSSFNATSGESAGSYLTVAQRDQLLTAAGIPAAPRSR